MSEKIFRKQDVTIQDKTIAIEHLDFDEIFKFNQPPYIILGNSGKGKTTICLDLLHRHAHECTNIYFVTKAEDKVNDNTINKIPEVYRRSPNFESLNKIWLEMNAGYSIMGLKPTKLLELISELSDRNTVTAIRNKLSERSNQLREDQKRLYEKAGCDDIPSLIHADIEAFEMEVLTRIAIDLANTRGTEKLSETSMYNLKSLVSEKPKTLLFLDDVSSELIQLATDKTKTKFKDKVLPIKDAYKALFMDILTRGRHMNAIICLFLHSTDIITQKDQIQNLIIMDSSVGGKVSKATTFITEFRETVKAVSPILFDNGYNYYFLYVSQFNDCKVCVGKAELYKNEEIEFSDLNSSFISVFNEISSNAEISTNQNADDGVSMSIVDAVDNNFI